MSVPLKNKFATFNFSPKAQSKVVNDIIKTSANDCRVSDSM